MRKTKKTQNRKIESPMEFLWHFWNFFRDFSCLETRIEERDLERNFYFYISNNSRNKKNLKMRITLKIWKFFKRNIPSPALKIPHWHPRYTDNPFRVEVRVWFGSYKIIFTRTKCLCLKIQRLTLIGKILRLTIEWVFQ